jgi:hypothetical protein
MKTNRPLVVWSRLESRSSDEHVALETEVRYAWHLTGGCPLQLEPAPGYSQWKFVMVIPEAFPVSGGVDCHVPGGKRYNVGGSSHEHITTGWVVISVDDVDD